jgi:ABC-type sulfate transport system permease component
MLYLINNIIDLAKIAAGLIAILVLLFILLPWKFLYEMAGLLLVMVWIAVKFWIREGYRAVKKMFRKKQNYANIDSDHELFI